MDEPSRKKQGVIDTIAEKCPQQPPLEARTEGKWGSMDTRVLENPGKNLNAMVSSAWWDTLVK